MYSIQITYRSMTLEILNLDLTVIALSTLHNIFYFIRRQGSAKEDMKQPKIQIFSFFFFNIFSSASLRATQHTKVIYIILHTRLSLLIEKYVTLFKDGESLWIFSK